MKHLDNILEKIEKIGFPDSPSDWQDAPAHFQQGTLEICGHPVMQEWERPYMAELAAVATRNGGRILEIGFGMAISAHYIQHYAIDEHVIIEANKDVFHKLQAFQQEAPQKVTPIFGLWQDVIASLESHSFDGILFDPYPLSEAESKNYTHPFFPHAFRLLKPKGLLTYYSDEVDSFSPEHKDKLIQAGFREIDSTICPVNPPPDCLYWTYPSFLVPIIRK